MGSYRYRDWVASLVLRRCEKKGTQVIGGRGSSAITWLLNSKGHFGEKEPFWWIVDPYEESETLSSTDNLSPLPSASTAPARSWPITDPFGMPW